MTVRCRTNYLRGPAAILCTSRDTFSESIAIAFRACFQGGGYRTIIARYVAKWGITQMCLCETNYHGGVSHQFGGALTSLKKYRAIWGIRSDSIAVSRDMGPLRSRSDRKRAQCTGKQSSRAVWSSFNKEGMSHLCDTTVAGPATRRDNVLASKSEYPPFRHQPPL